MAKEFHLYLSGRCCLHSYVATKRAIEQGQDRIDTTQLALVGTYLIHQGYRIFIHPELL